MAAKLLKLFGRKAPHPPRPDYTGRDPFTRSADDDFGFMRPSTDQNGRGTSVNPSAQNTLEGGSYVGSNGSVSSRRTGHRPTESESPSPSSRPIIAEDYSDPKDVVRVAQQSGLVIPPESPDQVGRPPEDDYSVPYDAQKVIEQIKQADDQKKSKSTEDSDMGNTLSTQASFKQSTSSSHQYEEPPTTGFVTPPSPGLHTTDDYADDEESDQYMDSNNLTRIQDHLRDDSSMSSESSENLRVTRSHSAHQRLQTPQNDARPHGEYDNPWEWKIKPPEHQIGKPGGGGSAGGPKSYQHQPSHGPLAESPRFRSRSDAMHLRGRTSPESDIRPHDEYDQPWEWIQNKNKSQSMMREKENIPSNRNLGENRRISSRKTSQGLKLDISPLKQPVAESVDPKMPLEEQKWYHGKLSRIDAEKKLKSQRECSYLVRQSESAARDYSLSLKSTKGFMHMKIIQHDEGFILGEFSKPFQTIPEMISYYTGHKLNIKGAAHMALIYPVTIEML